MIEEIEADKDQKGVCAGGIGKDECKQPPDLSLQNFDLIKAQPLVNDSTASDQAGQIDHRRNDADIKHQIGDALVPMAEAEALKACTQNDSLLKSIVYMIPVFVIKVYRRIMNK